MTTFHGKTYRYPTGSNGVRTIGVCLGLGSDIYIVAWIADSGGKRRVKTARLPAIVNPDRLQELLDVWAKERKLEEVTQ
ncbi:MAG: hypothetical protein M0T70_06605 [Geobacteraceae bacterium]|nr:hypothetical protein [Geobacteraceae bacterium]